MRKNVMLQAFMLITALYFGFTSCSNDDEDYDEIKNEVNRIEKEIVGTWEFKEILYDSIGEIVDECKGYIIYESDKTFSGRGQRINNNGSHSIIGEGEWGIMLEETYDKTIKESKKFFFTHQYNLADPHILFGNYCGWYSMKGEILEDDRENSKVGTFFDGKSFYNELFLYLDCSRSVFSANKIE